LKTTYIYKIDKEDERNSKNYANTLRSGINSQKGVEKQQEHDTSSWNIRSKFRRVETRRMFFSTRYENIFLGHCYTCRRFGHKAIHCKINARNNYMRNINTYGYPKDNHVNSRSGNAYGFVNINYNPFDPLMDQNIVCYKCKNLGHKTRYCRDMKADGPMPTTLWKIKENPKKEDCRLTLLVENKEDQ
jgi:hypothetical protein